MPNAPHLLVPALLFASLLPTAATLAQDSRPQKPELFTLAAGQHRVQTLVDLMAQIRRVKIHSDESEVGGDESTVTVQRELRLDGRSFEDVATTLLFYRGFIIVPDDKDGEHRVIALSSGRLAHESAVARTPAEILARPHKVEFVTTKLPPSDVPAMIRFNWLRPLFGVGRDPWSVRLGKADNDIFLKGTTAEVGFALRTIELVDGTPPTAQPTIAWRDSGELPWPGGKMKQAEFLQLFADTLDANTLDGNALRKAAETEVDLGEAAELTAEEWFARATKVLRAADQVIVPVDPEHRVFVSRPLQDPRAREVSWGAFFEAPSEVAKSTAIVPILTTFEPQHIPIHEVVNKARRELTAMKSCTVGTLNTTCLVVIGLRNDVVDLLEAFRKVDVAGK